MFEVASQLVPQTLCGGSWQLLCIVHPGGHLVGSPYKSMQVDFYQRVTGIGITNKNLQVNASWVNPIAMAGVRCVHFFGIVTRQEV